MRIGTSFPQVEIGTDPGAIRAFAEAAEGLGYEYLTCIDHVLGAGTPKGPPHARFYTRDRMFHEIFVLFGYLACCTQKIQLSSAVLILPQRQTALVAKQAAEIDVLSRGRLRLGVGLGWNEVEYVGLGQKFRTRARRFEEQIALMRRLWTEELVTFDGEFDRIEDAGINPLPVQQPIPIWVGAFVDAAIERAARVADGWMMNPRVAPGEEASRQIVLYRDAAKAAGRDPDKLGLEGTVLAEGGPDKWAAKAAAWTQHGTTHVTFRTMDCGFQGLDAHIDALRRFREAYAA